MIYISNNKATNPTTLSAQLMLRNKIWNIAIAILYSCNKINVGTSGLPDTPKAQGWPAQGQRVHISGKNPWALNNSNKILKPTITIYHTC